MKNFIRIALIALFVAAATNASAKVLPVSLGVKGGINMSTLSKKDYKSKVGYNAGITVDLNLPSNLALMTGLEINTKGAKAKEGDWKMNATYLQLPIHLGYKMDFAPGLSAHFDLGPYLAQGIGGKTKFTEEIYDDNGVQGTQKTSKNTFDNGFDKFDWGLGIGVGVTMLNKIRIQVGYDHGLKNISQSKEWKLRNRNVSASVGFLFF